MLLRVAVWPACEAAGVRAVKRCKLVLHWTARREAYVLRHGSCLCLACAPMRALAAPWLYMLTCSAMVLVHSATFKLKLAGTCDGSPFIEGETSCSALRLLRSTGARCAFSTTSTGVPPEGGAPASCATAPGGKTIAGVGIARDGGSAAALSLTPRGWRGCTEAPPAAAFSTPPPAVVRSD